MKLIMTKEVIEEMLGFEIQELKLEPMYEDSTCIGLSIGVIPVKPIEEILIRGIVNNI